MGKPVCVQRIDVTFDKVDHLKEIGPDEQSEVRKGLQAMREVGPAPNVSHRVITGRSRKRKANLPGGDSFRVGVQFRKGSRTVLVEIPVRESPEKKKMKCMSEVLGKVREDKKREEEKKKQRKRKRDTFTEGFSERKRMKITRENELMKKKSDLQVDEWVVSVEPEPPPEPTG